MSVDFSAVTAAWDRTPPNYTSGQTMRITITGQAVNTTDPTTVEETWGPFTIPITASAQTATVTVSAAIVTRTIPGQSTNEEVFIDGPAGGTLVIGGRSFLISADRKSVYAVA